MKKNKLLAVLLALAMTLTLLPTTALADGETGNSDEPATEMLINEDASSERVSSESTPPDSASSGESPDEDSTAAPTETTESCEESCVHVAAIGTAHYSTLAEAIEAVRNNETVELLKDSAGNGIVVASDRSFTVDFNGFTYDVNGKLVGSSGTETNSLQLLKDSTITFKNGTLTSSNSTYKSQILIQNYSNLTLDNMTVSAGTPFDYVISNNNGNVVIKDTTINAAEGKVAFDVCRYSSYTGPSVTVKGNSVINGNVEISSSGAKEGAVHRLNVTGGTFNGNIYFYNTCPDFVGNITGGTFSNDPTAYLAAGYAAVKDDDTNTWTVADNRVAEVNGQKFATLAAAIDNAKDNDTIKLLSDATASEALSISNKTLTLDLNENTLKLSAPSNYVNNGSDVTITNGTINLDDVSGKADCIIGVGGYDQQADSTLTLDKVTLTGSNYESPYAVLYVYGSSILNVQNSTMTLTGEKASAGGAIKASGISGRINITDSVLTFTDTVRGFLDGTLTIKDSTVTIRGTKDGGLDNAINSTSGDSTVTIRGTKDGGLDNAINSTSGGLALTIDHSNVTVSGGSGRGITLDGTSTAVVKNGSQVIIHGMSEAGIRFKNNTTGKFTIEGCDYSTPNGEVSVDTIVFGENVDASAFVLPSCYSVTNNQLVHNTTHTPPAPPSDSGSSGGSGGGSSGSSNTSSTTVKNPDGSTTTTTTDKKTGTITETTKNTDGSVTTVETKKDGTITETNKAADGTTGTVATDKNGEVTEAKASVSATAAKEAAKTGEAVTLPVEVPTAKTTGDAPAVEVTMPRSTGSVKVEIPVEKVTPGTVAVIVQADGTEKIVSTSAVTENGVALTLSGSTTVKVFDNAKSFTDVSATNVFYNEICSLSAREIMVGKTDEKFDLYSSVTLNQIANVAGRITGAVDVKDYNAGIAWGAENGLKTGNMDASRGDVLKALYMAAGSPVVEDTGVLTRFNDASAIPADLTAAAAWAAQNGILKGDFNGNASLNANVTRGQACALAGRTMGTLVLD